MTSPEVQKTVGKILGKHNFHKSHAILLNGKWIILQWKFLCKMQYLENQWSYRAVRPLKLVSGINALSSCIPATSSRAGSLVSRLVCWFHTAQWCRFVLAFFHVFRCVHRSINDVCLSVGPCVGQAARWSVGPSVHPYCLFPDVNQYSRIFSPASYNHGKIDNDGNTQEKKKMKWKNKKKRKKEKKEETDEDKDDKDEKEEKLAIPMD